MARGNADNHSHYATSSQPLDPYWRAVFNAMDRAEAAEKHASEVRSLIYTINQIRAEQRAGIFRGWGSDGKYRDVSVPPGVIPGATSAWSAAATQPLSRSERTPTSPPRSLISPTESNSAAG